MNRRLVTLAAAVSLVLCIATSARAEDREEPTTHPVPDLSTARSAALAWLDASWAGNAPLAHEVLVDDEQQRKFVAAPLRFSAALRKLEEAAVERFGGPGRQVSGYPDLSANALEKQLKIEEDGDRATASLADAMMPLKLRRIDGKWRVDLSEMVRDPRAQRLGAASIATAEVAEDVADEIAAGKFATVQEATAAFRERRPPPAR